MSLVNKSAPVFKASAVIQGKKTSNFSLEQYLDKQHVLFFFFPKAFTGVCNSEVVAFQDHLAEFEQRNVALVACSTDTDDTLIAWSKMTRQEGGIQGVSYPIVADMSKTIASNYGVLGGDYVYENDGTLAFEGIPLALRGSFLIDKKGIIRHLVINHLPLGRSTEETLRMIDVLQHFEQYGESCPMDWKKK